MRGINQRLRRLESAPHDRGWRNFTQDLDDPAVYWEHAPTDDWREMNVNGFSPQTNAIGGVPWSRDDIARLESDGWNCMVLTWVRDWRST